MTVIIYITHHRILYLLSIDLIHTFLIVIRMRFMGRIECGLNSHHHINGRKSIIAPNNHTFAFHSELPLLSDTHFHRSAHLCSSVHPFLYKFEYRSSLVIQSSLEVIQRSLVSHLCLRLVKKFVKVNRSEFEPSFPTDYHRKWLSSNF